MGEVKTRFSAAIETRPRATTQLSAARGARASSGQRTDSARRDTATNPLERTAGEPRLPRVAERLAGAGDDDGEPELRGVAVVARAPLVAEAARVDEDDDAA